jgi:hypothetical protein
MPKLTLADIRSEKPVKLTVELPASVHRDLTAYAEVLARETGRTPDPATLIAPMLVRFMAGDREFARARPAIERNKAPKPGDL